MKSNKLIEKYSLDNLNAVTKQKEHNYFNNLKDNLENFNNTLSQTNFIDEVTSLSDIEEEEEDLYSDPEENKIPPWYTDELEVVETVDEKIVEELEEPIEEPVEEELQLEQEIHEEIDLQELPNLDNMEDNVDDYIKQILESKDDIDVSNLEFTQETEKKKNF
jgi:hypothetical protein